MRINLVSFFRLVFAFLLVFACLTPWMAADVSKEVVTEYENNYVNRARFLKIPVRGERQTVFIRGNNIIPDSSSAGSPPSFLVGEQVRVTSLRFRNNSIEFGISSIDGTKRSTLVYQFAQQLEFGFPEKTVFDKALGDSLTTGLSYREIESAKREYIQKEFSRVAQQMAQTTSTDNSFVMGAIATEIPEVSAAIQSRDRAQEELSDLQSEYEEADSERQRLNYQVQELRGQLNRAEEENRAVRTERDNLARQGSSRDQELQRLMSENAKTKEQLSSLAREMDIQLGSNSDLTGQVNSLSKSLGDLRTEWASLQERMKSTEAELNKIRDERNKLTSDLTLSNRKASQLESRLNSLTSNRDSLEATYVRTKEQLDNLELAGKTSESLSLEKVSADKESPKGTQAYEVNLLSKKIGLLTVTPPASIREPGTARFTVESPDTVQFSEEERLMFASLGKEIQVRAEWISMGGDLETSLTSGDAVQSVPPRETAEWAWSFSGSPEMENPAQLRISFVDSNQNAVPVTELEFSIEPESIIPLKLGGSIWIPALAGFILGSLLALLLVGLTGKKKNGGGPRKEKPRRDPSAYSTQKDL